MEVSICKAEIGHEKELLNLFKKVVTIPDGIIRKRHEITANYINDFYEKSLENGLILFAKSKNSIVGEIHAYTPSIYAFQHILTDLTIAIYPEFQGKGIGRKLFQTFLEIVKTEFHHILRVELYTREHNKRNVAFYKSLGFINEGRQQHKIFNSKSKLETPLHMAWFNPNYLK
ncbi:MAG: GNAT family N-acetyltransferase [Bacteroidota bacterium]